MLLLTEECNLNCVYCYEHFKSKRKMSFDTARSILDNFYSSSKPGDTVLIEVFGGEPFTNFELIKQIDDYVMTMYGDRNTFLKPQRMGLLYMEKFRSG